MRREAFTIIELLVVIAVIALLAGLILPVLSSVKESARRAKCGSNLHAVSVAMRLYLNQNDDYMPAAAQMPSLELNDLPRIADVLRPHLPGPEALRCPSDTENKYYISEGSSYAYRTMLSGRRVGDSFLTRRWGEAKTPVMHDYEPFHGQPGEPGSSNYLFADGHVGDLE